MTVIDPTELQHRPSPEPTHRLNPKLRLAASSPNIKALFDGAPPSATQQSSHQQSPSQSSRRVLDDDPLPPFYSPPASAGLSLLPTTSGISAPTTKERTLHHQHSLSHFPTSTSTLSSTSKTNGSTSSNGAIGDFSSWKSLRPIVSTPSHLSTQEAERIQRDRLIPPLLHLRKSIRPTSFPSLSSRIRIHPLDSRTTNQHSVR